MDEILKKFLNESVLNEETKKAVKKAFDDSLAEARKDQEKAIRAELAEQYEVEKANIHKALELFLEQELSGHVGELREGVEEINKLKLDYAKKITEAKQGAQKYVKAKVAAMEKAIEEVLKKELSEVHSSEVTNRRAYLKAIAEKQAALEADRVKFRKEAAAILENIINVHVSSALDELKEDIQAARKSDFGREMFEAFAVTFRRQFFNSNAEFRKLAEAMKAKDEELKKTKKTADKAVKEARELAATADAARKRVIEAAQRQAEISRLLAPLKGNSREQMKTLLEATKTADLGKTFRRYSKEMLSEAKKPVHAAPKVERVVELFDGNNGSQINESAEDEEIVKIRKLAGTRK